MSDLLPVSEALARLLAGVAPRPAEEVTLADAAGRILAQDVIANRTQPPFPASAMDGYAVRASDIAAIPSKLAVIGHSVAGKRFNGSVGADEAVRIFTGAPIPDGADTILIQENTRDLGGNLIEATQTEVAGRHIRSAGLDFAAGDVVLTAGRALDAAALSLAAAANHPRLQVIGRPLVAIIATGDELVLPGSEPSPDQIIASNSYGVAALVRNAGGEVLDLGIVTDDLEKISKAIALAVDAGADIIVTLGGASVGDHDLVGPALAVQGMTPDFWKIAMRPGKPLMSGQLRGARVLGLPGNPVSSLVCSHIFLKPLVAALAGRVFTPDLREAILGAPMPENDHRHDYVRAIVENRDGRAVATAFPRQDSSMLTTLAKANALIIRAPHAPQAPAGTSCQILMLR